MNKRLDFLLRKNRGNIDMYEDLFLKVGFTKDDLNYIPLDAFDEVIEKLKTFANNTPKDEFLYRADADVTDSHLLTEIMDKFGDSYCYIYTDDFKHCGAYCVKIEIAFKLAMKIAFNDFQNTCFLLDKNFRYYFRINFYGSDHGDGPNTFDIRREILQ